jgi:hypothetical protein
VNDLINFRSFRPLFYARTLWQIAQPPLGGVAAICHHPLGVWHPKKKRRTLTSFDWFLTKTSQAGWTAEFLVDAIATRRNGQGRPYYRALIDTGALITGLTNYQVAREPFHPQSTKFPFFWLLGNTVRSRYRAPWGASLRSGMVPSVVARD